MDFRRLLEQQGSQAPIDPRELYASLPSKALGYGYLRDVQAQVLEAWHVRRDARDLVIKVNTGSGKTIDGLVILQSYLNGGEGPALYVAPDRYLAQQVQTEAERIGIPTVNDPDHVRYLSGEAIAVVNAHKLVNGRSVFSSTRPQRPAAPIGSVVIDDVHAALATTRAQLSITLPLEHKAYSELLDLFTADLEAQSPNALLDVRDRSFGALARIPFWAWRSRVGQVRQILHSHRTSDELSFTWPAVQEVLPICRAVFTGQALTITPPCPPVRHITGLSDAKHRVYLTATLADDSVLVTDFNADPAGVSSPITPLSAGDIGERMILAPQEINPDLDAGEIRRAIASLATRVNVVILVPSTKAAAAWQPFGPAVVHADQVESIVDRLRDGHVGLVVLVNKYDGIDLPGDACRVLVLDGLPEAFNGEERLESQLLTRSVGIDDRQVQRIEQGMGRGVRSNEDHCVVFLIGARLSQLVADPRSSERFSGATRAQLQLSRDVASTLGEATLDGIMEVAGQALNRDPDWMQLAKRALSNVPAPSGTVSDTAAGRRRAFEAATDGDFAQAAQLLATAAGATTDTREQGWLLEQQAVYLDQLDPERAQQVLAVARGKNPLTLRPLSGVTFQRISASAPQAQQCSDFLRETYPTATALRLGFESLLLNLEFDPDRTEEFESSFRLLGEHLGFVAQRPEQELGSGPDVLWALGGLKYWVIEAKSGATTSFIGKRDANQLSGSINWFRERYDATASATPILVHPSRQLARDATATVGMAVIEEERLESMRSAVRGLAGGLASTRYDDAEEVDRLLAGHRLRAGDLAGYTRATRASK